MGFDRKCGICGMWLPKPAISLVPARDVRFAKRGAGTFDGIRSARSNCEQPVPNEKRPEKYRIVLCWCFFGRSRFGAGQRLPPTEYIFRLRWFWSVSNRLDLRFAWRAGWSLKCGQANSQGEALLALCF